MQQKIRFITDSACDMPVELEKRYNIEILSIPLTVEGVGYQERKDFTPQQFCNLLLEVKSIPTTSHIPSPLFMERYEAAFSQECTDIIHLTINSKGSNMYAAALMARDMFFEEHPEAKGKITIHILDSKTYSASYAYALCCAAKMAEESSPVSEILIFLDNFINSAETYFSVYSLDFAKKSGRISGAAAFVGDVLGLRPIMSIVDGELKIIDKVRGDKNVVPQLAKIALRHRKPGTEYGIIRGIQEGPAQDLAELMTKETKLAPAITAFVGSSVAINSGPKVVAVFVLGKNKKTGE